MKVILTITEPEDCTLIGGTEVLHVDAVEPYDG